jgi:pyruvate/2-oxoglutarate/acetoin dehydrogenase E1 component
MKYIENLRHGIEKCISQHNAIVMGEDIGEPYGGAFKVTKGLSVKYPDNIFMTPMSEQGFTGAGIGNALCGGYVIVEIMFGDFITLCADQIINHAAKLYDLYGTALHFILRTPVGGYRGYGATHSQSLERIFCGIPGINVLAPSVFHFPGDMLLKAIESGKPTLFIENKLDYNRDIIGSDFIEDYFGIIYHQNIITITIKGEKPAATLITYGGMAFTAYQAAQKLMLDAEIPIEIVVISDLNLDSNSIRDIINSDRVYFLEEGWKNHGIGAEFISAFASHKNVRIGAGSYSILSGKKLEYSILPNETAIVKTIKDGLS